MTKFEVLLVILFACFELHNGAEVHQVPAIIPPVTEGDQLNLKFCYTYNGTLDTEAEWANVFVVAQRGHVTIQNSSINLSPDVENGTVSLFAELFGHDILTVTVTLYHGSNTTTELYSTFVSEHRVRVLRREGALDIIFITCIAIFVLVNNINMGCVLDKQVLMSVVKKPVGPLVGFCSQFVFMPLASYGVALALLDNPAMQLGLFTLGCCPGGTGSNFWTFLFRGDVNLSVVMTFFSTVAALAMMPLWLFTLGRIFFREGEIQIPYDHLVISLVSFGVPVVIGLLIRHFRPNWAKKSEKIIRPYTIIILIFFMTIGTYSNLYLIKLMSWQIVVAGIIVSWGAYLFGAVAAMVFCMNRDQVIAISIETALQNPAVAFILLKVSLPQPDADIASASPVAQLMVTGIPLWIAYIVYCIKRPRKTKKDETAANKEVAFSHISKNSEDENDQKEKARKPSNVPLDMWISTPLPLETSDIEKDKMFSTRYSLIKDDDEEDELFSRLN